MTHRSRLLTRLVGSLAAGLAGCGVAWAQTAEPDQGGAPADHAATYTLQGENASISTARLTDRYYVNGIRVGFTSGTGAAPEFANDLARTLFGAGQTRYSVGVSQQLYTPRDDQARNPPAGDRPYAATLLAHLSLQQDSADTRSTVGIDLGVLGPSALGEQVQNGFHDLIAQDHANGWHTQLRDEPAFELLSSRVWRMPLGSVGPFETDALLDLSAGLGNLKVYAEGGGQVRIGQGLGSDFGVARLRPGPSGGDTFTPTRTLAYYAFAGISGQAIAHNELLDGETFRNSQGVRSEPFVGEFQAGLGVIYHGVRLTYTQVVQSNEFRHQKGGPHQFGSLALSVRF